MSDVTKKFSDNLKEVLTQALIFAVENELPEIKPIHLFQALATKPSTSGYNILQRLNIISTDFEDFHTDQNKLPKHQKNIPPLSKESRDVIEKAVQLAYKLNHQNVGTEHLLSTVIFSPSEQIQNLIKSKKINLRNIQIEISLLFYTSKQPFNANLENKLNALIPELENVIENELHQEDTKSDTPALDYFCDELTVKEITDEQDLLIGRKEELHRLMEIVNRKNKNNPILVGEPGVGKTALVEGLAKLIVDKTAPASLIDKKIFQLDLTSLIAGTMYRGEFESRLRQLIDEVTDRPEIILFIDEIHMISGAGATSGALDASNILKPALARGDIRCIGATTTEEYKKTIETDKALERRFQVIRVYEPNAKETQQIINGIKSSYEKYHSVEFTKEAIEKTVELAEQFFTHKHFPDKAIDILDEAGSLSDLKRKTANPTKQIKTLNEELEQIKQEKTDKIKEEDFKEAQILKEKEKTLKNDIKKLKQKLAKRKASIITEEHIIQIVSKLSGVPIEKLTSKENNQIRLIASQLKNEILGQTTTINKVTQAIQRAKLGLHNLNKPLSSFLFVGPTGVGKTQLAQTLANVLFENKNSFLRLDMSEYSASFTASKLVGAPAGYVGYRDSNKLTDFVKAHPHSVILFDELEKAHSDVQNLLLQILDNGIITDSTGREINFRNTIIIMTSNIGNEHFEKNTLGFSSASNTVKLRDEKITKELIQNFSRELINRINHTCIFNTLSKDILLKITQKKLTELSKKLNKKNIQLTFEKKTAEIIVKKINTNFGAREIDRIIEKTIEHPLVDMLLSKNSSNKKSFITKIKNNAQITLTISKK